MLFCHLWSFFFKQTLSKKKKSFRNTIRDSNSLAPDQARRFVGPDLNPNCLLRLSADDKSRHRERVNEQNDMFVFCFLLLFFFFFFFFLFLVFIVVVFVVVVFFCFLFLLLLFLLLFFSCCCFFFFCYFLIERMFWIFVRIASGGDSNNYLKHIFLEVLNNNVPA